MPGKIEDYALIGDLLTLRAGLRPERHLLALQRSVLDHLEKIWSRPDQGLWETRGAPRQHVHSKVMCPPTRPTPPGPPAPLPPPPPTA